MIKEYKAIAYVQQHLSDIPSEESNNIRAVINERMWKLGLSTHWQYDWFKHYVILESGVIMHQHDEDCVTVMLSSL